MQNLILERVWLLIVFGVALGAYALSFAGFIPAEALGLLALLGIKGGVTGQTKEPAETGPP